MPEFIDAIARVADKLNNLPDFFPDFPAKNPYKLDKKIESFMMILCKKCLKTSISEVLEKQIKKIFETEAALPKEKKYDISNKQY